MRKLGCDRFKVIYSNIELSISSIDCHGNIVHDSIQNETIRRTDRIPKAHTTCK